MDAITHRQRKSPQCGLPRVSPGSTHLPTPIRPRHGPKTSELRNWRLRFHALKARINRLREAGRTIIAQREEWRTRHLQRRTCCVAGL
jgi:hypothetical protein